MRSYQELTEDEDLDLEGNSEHQYELGMCLLLGNGCDKNIDQAHQYLMLAAEAKYPKAVTYMQEFSDKNKKKEKQVSKKTIPVEAYGSMSTLQLYQRVETGDIRAAVVLAKQMKGTPNRANEAFQVLFRFEDASIEDIDALVEVQYLLGELYETGAGTTKNEEKAFLCYQNAAEFNYAPAIDKIAHCYDKGIGTPKNKQLALSYKEQRAQGGSAKSCYEVGEAYRQGTNAPKNKIKALLWYAKALSSNDGDIYYYLSAFHLIQANEPCEVSREDAFKKIETAAKKGNLDCINLLIGYSSNPRERLSWYHVLLKNTKQRASTNANIMETLLKLGDREELIKEAKSFSCEEEIIKKGIGYGYQICIDEFRKQIEPIIDQKDIKGLQQACANVQSIHAVNEAGKQGKAKLLQQLNDVEKDIRLEKIRREEQEEQERRQVITREQQKRKIFIGSIVGVVIALICVYQYVIAPMISEATRDYFEECHVSYEGFSPMATLSFSSSSEDITYSASKTDQLKNGETIVITATNKESGKTKEKEYVVDSPYAYITSMSEFKPYQADFLSRLMEKQREYFYYTYEDKVAGRVFSTKLVDAYLLTRSDDSMSYTEDKVNQLAGIVEVTYKNGKQVYALIDLSGIYTQSNEEVTIDEYDSRTPDNFYSSKSEAVQVMNKTGFVVEQLKGFTLTQKEILKLPTLLDANQAKSYQSNLKDILKEEFTYQFEGSFGSGQKKISSYELTEVYFMEQSDQMMVYNAQMANGVVGVYKFVMDDGTTSYAALFVPNLIIEAKQVQKYTIVSSDTYFGTLESTPKAALEVVSEKYDVTSLQY